MIAIITIIIIIIIIIFIIITIIVTVLGLQGIVVKCTSTIFLGTVIVLRVCRKSSTFYKRLRYLFLTHYITSSIPSGHVVDYSTGILHCSLGWTLVVGPRFW